MNSSQKYRQGLPRSSLARMAFAIVITVFVVVFEWADLKAGREARIDEKHEF